MGERDAKYFVNGTSALDMRCKAAEASQTRIIAFPQRNIVPLTRESAEESRVVRLSPSFGVQNARSAIRAVLNSSEMYCSLKYESFTGCPYDRLAKKNIALLSAGSAFIAIVSLAFGA